MKILLWIVSAYSLGITTVLLLNRYRNAHERELLKLLDEVPFDRLEPVARLEALAKAGEVRSKQVPWYERSLSTIGAIGFFSMLVATGLQTTNANLSDAKLQKLQGQMETLKAQQASLEPAVARAAQAAIEQYWLRHILEDGAEEVLRLRLDTLQASPAKGMEKVAEMLDIALVLRDVQRAVSLVEEHPEFYEAAEPFQLVSIAESYVISGSTAHAAETLKRLEGDLSTLGSPLRFRVLVLKAVLGSDREQLLSEVSMLLRVGMPEARARLQHDVERLRGLAADFARR